jgi:thiamine-monophosphate kinase
MVHRTQLSDFGERRIVREVLGRYVAGLGDDCARVSRDTEEIVITMDPVPEPAAALIGGDADPYWMGWLLVTINASDLAAAGAKPLAFLASIEAPSSYELSQLERFLGGVRDSCLAQGLLYVGGNLKEAPRLSATGVAIGRTPLREFIGRSGAMEDDFVVSVGQGGGFWQDALLMRGGIEVVNKEASPLFRPISQVRPMQILGERRLVKAAIDNSDGLLPSLTQLATANDLAITIDFEQLTLPGLDPRLKVAPWRLWMGWGDWNVVCAVWPTDVQEALALAAENGFDVRVLGRFTLGESPRVRWQRGECCGTFSRLDSERFAKDSWFHTGIQAYIDSLLKMELIEATKR